MRGRRLRRLIGEIFERLGLDAILERQLARLKAALSWAPAAGPQTVGNAPSADAGQPPPTASPRSKTSSRPAGDPVETLLAQLLKHPEREALIEAGTQKDQLLRSLVPLYLAQGLGLEVNSGVISRFWQAHSVSYAASNAAKALRQNEGHARTVAGGREITPVGVAYVETALAKARGSERV